MGATLWYHEAPWHSDPNESLKALQADFLLEHYNLEELLPDQLKYARLHLQAEIEDGDQFGLVDWCHRKVKYLEELINNPIPESIEAQIEIIRRVFESGQGLSNILDITGVTESRCHLKAECLSEEETIKMVGCTHPTVDQAEAAIDKINNELGRGESVCFQTYDYGKPVGWYFVGNSID